MRTRIKVGIKAKMPRTKINLPYRWASPIVLVRMIFKW